MMQDIILGAVDSNALTLGANVQDSFNSVFAIAVTAGIALIVWRWIRKAVGR